MKKGGRSFVVTRRAFFGILPDLPIFLSRMHLTDQAGWAMLLGVHQRRWMPLKSTA